jgi:hypothetical protein
MTFRSPQFAAILCLIVAVPALGTPLTLSARRLSWVFSEHRYGPRVRLLESDLFIAHEVNQRLPDPQWRMAESTARRPTIEWTRYSQNTENDLIPPIIERQMVSDLLFRTAYSEHLALRTELRELRDQRGLNALLSYAAWRRLDAATQGRLNS